MNLLFNLNQLLANCLFIYFIIHLICILDFKYFENIFGEQTKKRGYSLRTASSFFLEKELFFLFFFWTHDYSDEVVTF